MNELHGIEERLRDATRAFAGGVEPAPDAWERLDRRTRAASRRRRAISIGGASAVAAAALVAGVLMFADDDPTRRVETPPATDPSITENPLPRPSVQVLPGRTIASGSGCPFGISGDPVDMLLGPNGGRFDTVGGQGVAHVLLGSQTAEVRVPGFELADESGWRFEPVDLGGRSAQVWLDGPASAGSFGNLPFVQVRYFPGTDEPCSSFTVTVDGGSVEANRQTAIDLAARVLLPAELDDLDLPGTEGGPVAGLDLPGTTWHVAAGEDSGDGGEMTFTDTTVRWTDGCATLTSNYELDRDGGILTLTNTTSTDPGCTPPTHPDGVQLAWPIIASVMGTERINVSLIDGHLYLGDYREENYLDLESPTTVGTPPALPEPGEQPADRAAAEAQVRAAFTGLFDATQPREDRTQYVDRPEIWLAADQALMEGPNGALLHDLHAVVDTVVFTSPTHASVRLKLLHSGESIFPYVFIGDALFVEGRWVVSIATPCFAFHNSPEGVGCDDFSP